MIEYVIRRAIIWAITIAVVAGVTAAVAGATKKAMSKSLEKKLTDLGIDVNDPDPELMKELIVVQVVRRGAYIISVEENVYGLFSTSYMARNKEDAIKTLGKKVFGFANVNRDILTKEQLDFYLRIWHETFMKNRIEDKKMDLDSKLMNIRGEIESVSTNITIITNKIEAKELKLEKLSNMLPSNDKKQLKIDGKISNIKQAIKELRFDILAAETLLKNSVDEYDIVDKELNSLDGLVENPVFLTKGKIITLKGFALN